MNKHLAFIPITGLVLLTLAGCGTTPNANGVNNSPVKNTTTSQSDYALEVALIKNKGYSVSGTTPNATVKTATGETLSAWMGVSGRDAHSQFVFFFLNGKYVGTDTAKPSVEITSAAAIGNSITVTYPVYKKNDSFADPTGTPVTITYAWNGTNLAPNHPYPKQFS